VARIPVRRAARDAQHEVLQHPLAVDGVRHLGVELHAVVAGLGVGHDGKRARLALREHAEAVRQLGNLVAVRHPDDAALAHALEQPCALHHVEFRAPVLGAFLRRRDLAAGVLRHPLQPVADAQYGHALLQDRGIERRRIVFVHRTRATREDDRLRPHGRKGEHRALGHGDARVHAHLAHAARDQLAVLRPEVDDQHAPGGGGVCLLLAHASAL